MREFAGYRLLEELGEGGAAKVYLATPLTTKPFAGPGEPVALKLYNQQILREAEQALRIRQELRASIEAAHPNVVRAYEAEADHPDGAYLAMEYVDGMPLSRWGRMFCPIPDRLLLHIVAQVVEGLSALHARGIIHRDLKPDNVMLSSSFAAKIMDLGVVRLTKDRGITPGDRFLGSTRNSSPELLIGGTYDERTDLYSLGTIIYFLLHGHELFRDTTHRNQLVQCVLNSDIPFDESLAKRSAASSRLVDLATRLLRKNPSERPSTIDNVRAELQEIIGKASDPVEPLHAYVASALTGLATDAREAVVFISDMVARVCKDFDLYVYQPRKATDPILHAEVKPESVYELDRKRVLQADVLFVIANQPSFGVGQELEIAASVGKPTVLLRREATTVSRMVTGSFINLLADLVYNSPEDLERKIRDSIPPALRKFRATGTASRGASLAKLGARLASLREAAGFSQEEAAEALGLSRHLLRALEQRPTSYHNAGVVVLDRLTTLYGAPLRDLFEDRPPVPRRSADDRSLRALDAVAIRQKWSAEDLLLLRQDYTKELAASGRDRDIDDEGWLERHRLLEKRREKEKASAQSGPDKGTSLPLFPRGRDE